jgi:predicted  nucleic acid-binding Zn-ribbon protein
MDRRPEAPEARSIQTQLEAARASLFAANQAWEQVRALLARHQAEVDYLSARDAVLEQDVYALEDLVASLEKALKSGADRALNGVTA